MEAKTLLGAIGNALLQERLIRKYEIRAVMDGSGNANHNLYVVIADADATGLVIETLEDVEANALLLRSPAAPPQLVQICSQTQVDLADSELARESGGTAKVSQVRALDMFLDAFERHLAAGEDAAAR